MLPQRFTSVIFCTLKNAILFCLLCLSTCLTSSLILIIGFIWIQHNMNNLVKTLRKYIWGKNTELIYSLLFLKIHGFLIKTIPQLMFFIVKNQNTKSVS